MYYKYRGRAWPDRKLRQHGITPTMKKFVCEVSDCVCVCVRGVVLLCA